MRKTIIAAVTAVSLAGIGGGAMLAMAQQAPPPGPGPGAGFEGPPGPHPHWGPHSGPHWGPHWGPWWHHHMRDGHGPFAGPRTFALVYPHADRKLSPADVQTIAQAFLLWHGNHSWKVVDVAPTQDGKIGFAYATSQGGVIARFTMDPHTGRLMRVD